MRRVAIAIAIGAAACGGRGVVAGRALDDASVDQSPPPADEGVDSAAPATADSAESPDAAVDTAPTVDEGWKLIHYEWKVRIIEIIAREDCTWIEDHWGLAHRWTTAGMIGEPALYGDAFAAASCSDAWAFGGGSSEPYRLHWTGAEVVRSPMAEVIWAAWQSSAEEMIAVGPEHSYTTPITTFTIPIAVMRQSKAGWSRLATLTPGPTGVVIGSFKATGSAANNVWITWREKERPPVVMRWDGTKLVTLPTAPVATIDGLWVRGVDDAWIVTRSGVDRVFHYDGAKWNADPDPLTRTLTPAAIWGNAEGELWTVGVAGEIAHRTKTGWVRAKSPEPYDLWSIDGNAREIWAGGMGPLIHRALP
jgi:hypothetical protein